MAGEARLQGPGVTWRLVGDGSTVSCEAPANTRWSTLLRGGLPGSGPLRRLDRVLRAMALTLEVRRGRKPLAYLGSEQGDQRRFPPFARLLDRLLVRSPLRPAWFGTAGPTSR
ncbi:hypothetical protein ABI59_11750 [Acidobacteria bacterium Mor1]|nr:hypothetical protein ABI59_11750 [Acidobacteria bacterium Mor1]